MCRNNTLAMYFNEILSSCFSVRPTLKVIQLFVMSGTNQTNNVSLQVLLQALLLLHHHRRTEEYFLSLRFSAGSGSRLFLPCTSSSLFWLIKQQFWCQTYLNVPSSAASLVSSSWRVSSDTAVPAAWISYNKVITHVTLNESHQWVQFFNFHKSGKTPVHNMQIN